jgi:hypothetical protein
MYANSKRTRYEQRYGEDRAAAASQTKRNVGLRTPAANFPSLERIDSDLNPCLIEDAHGLALAKIVCFPPAFELLDNRQKFLLWHLTSIIAEKGISFGSTVIKAAVKSGRTTATRKKFRRPSAASHSGSAARLIGHIFIWSEDRLQQCMPALHFPIPAAYGRE